MKIIIILAAITGPTTEAADPVQLFHCTASLVIIVGKVVSKIHM